MPLRVQAARPLSLSELGESELPTILEEPDACADEVEKSSPDMSRNDDLFLLPPKRIWCVASYCFER